MNSNKKRVEKPGKIGKKDVKNLTNALAFLESKAYTVTGFDPERSGTFLCGVCVKKVTKGAALFCERIR